MNYRTIEDLNQLILSRLYILPRDFDLIVGIPRSGMFPANLLALYLNLPYTDLGSFINGHIYKAGEREKFFETKEYKRVLVVDDSIASGSAMNKCKEMLKPFADLFIISYCAVYIQPGKEKMVDFYFDQVPFPRYFQWNILNHTILNKACVDIDGVLCVDPTSEQNDDGEKYIDFLLHAQPLFIPGSRIGALVTSRLEKYRKETESWLKNNKVKYDRLIMLDLPNKEARIKANCHALHKATEYQSEEYSLFIESSLSQAFEINKITKKPVLCTENFKMIFDSQSLFYNIKSGHYLPFIRKIAMRLRNKLVKR